MLAGLGIRDMFSVVIGADKVEKSKPAPDMILLASETAGTPIGNVVYVGDQSTDIRAASTAGTLAGVAVKNIIEEATESTTSVVDFEIIKES